MTPVRPSPAQLDAWTAFLHAHVHLVRRLDDELRAAHDLPLEWYDVLLQLHDAGGALRMGDLADAVVITAPNCTRLVDRMVTVGLVTRFTDPDDARIKRATLTDAGRARLRDAAPTHLRGIALHFATHVPDRLAVDVATAFRAAADSS